MTNSTLIPRVTTFYPSKIIHILIYPFLTGFLLDLPWINQTIVAIAFVLATLLVGDFVEALVALWQATAVAGVIMLIVDYFSTTGINPNSAALSIPLTWCAVLILRRSHLGINKSFHKLTASDVIGSSLVLFCSTSVPRGRLENFGFLAAEDNERWLTSVIAVIRGEALTFGAGFDSYSVQYFTKFVLNGFLYLLGINISDVPERSLLSINVLANAWIFALVTALLLSIRVTVRLLAYLQPDSRNRLPLFVVGLMAILFFRASHDAGHYPQYLLNIVILVFMVSIIDLRPGDNISTKVKNGIVLFTISLSVVGSYNPWLPISLVCLFLTANSLVRGTILRRLFRSSKLPYFLFVCFGVGLFALKNFSKKYGGLDEGGAVWAVPLEAVWLVAAIASIGAIELIHQKIATLESSSSDGDRSRNWVPKIIPLLSLATLIILYALGIERNQFITVASVLVVGLVFHRQAINGLRRSFRILYSSQEFDAVTMLGLFSFLYALVIYAMSRFVGPLYEPMYAANKSMLAVFGQFSFLPYILISVKNQKFEMRLIQMKFATIALTFIIVLGVSPYVRYRSVQIEWWQEPALKSIADYPDAVVVCVNQEWISPNFQVYNCNRYLQTLTSFEYPASGFRYLAWYQPDEFEKISDWFGGSKVRARPFTAETRVIVLCQGELSPETKQIFKDVASEMIEYRIVK